MLKRVVINCIGTAGRLVTINVVTIKKQRNRMGYNMNKVLFLVLVLAACLSSCSKTTDVVAQISAQEVKDDQIITTYLKSHNINASVVDSAGVSTGIYYTIDTLGTGSNLFANSTQITVSYKGWQLTASGLGPQLIPQDRFHPSFVLGGVIRGWQLGIPESEGGGTITLYLPSHYAYGPYPQNNYDLPANAVMVFQITIYSVTN